MAAPKVSIAVQDNALGQSLPGQGNLLYVIGVSASGVAYQPLTSTNPNDFTTSFGYGPGPELAGFIAASTGNPVAFCKVQSAAAGSNGIITKSNSGGSVMTLTGTPLDTYYGLVSVVVGGTIGTAGIQINVSLDAGRTVYQTVNLGTATTYAVPNTGLTLNFAAGSVVAGDTYSWVSSEPQWTDAGVQSAINALIPLPSLIPEDIIVAGGPSKRNGEGTVGAQSADLTAIDGYMTTLFNKRRFNRCLLHASDAMWGGASTETEAAWTSALQTDYASASSLRVGVTAGHYNAISPFSSTQFRRPLLWQAAARDSAVAIQVDLGRVKDGALANMPLPSKPDGYIYHDENVNPGLDAARFMTATSITGLQGMYITNPNLMAPPGSDFNWLQHGHVVDAASSAAYTFFVTELSDSVRVDASGHILAQDANDLQGRMNAVLANDLVNNGAASSATCVVSRTDNILQTATLTVSILIQPLGYLKTINVTISFTNVAVQQLQGSPGGP